VSSDILPVSGPLSLPRTFCSILSHRYSKKAKDLLELYDLSPKPIIIEVDLRGV
jgi:hypothetical protein